MTPLQQELAHTLGFRARGSAAVDDDGFSDEFGGECRIRGLDLHDRETESTLNVAVLISFGRPGVDENGLKIAEPLVGIVEIDVTHTPLGEWLKKGQ